MATPKRPEFPDWYKAEHKSSPNIGPTQREMLARRIKSLRKFLIGASFVGVATFTALASQHSGTKATTTTQSGTTALVQSSGSTSTASTSTTDTSSNSATLSSATSSQSTTSNTSSSQSASSLRTKTASS